MGEMFRTASQELRWADMGQPTGIGSTLSVDAPREGSVWAMILSKVTRSYQGLDLNECEVEAFVTEALMMKCWRRDQKIEHREVLEGLATGLTLHILTNIAPKSDGRW